MNALHLQVITGEEALERGDIYLIMADRCCMAETNTT